MAARKKQEVEPQIVKKVDYKKVLARIGIGALIGAVLWLVADKFSEHQVICQILGADQESGVIAARCMIK